MKSVIEQYMNTHMKNGSKAFHSRLRMPAPHKSNNFYFLLVGIQEEMKSELRKCIV